MWRTDAACAYRAPQPELRFADLSVHLLRCRRKLPEGDVVRPSRRLQATESDSLKDSTDLAGELLAGDLRVRGVEDAGAGDLRGDQERGHNGRHTDQPEKLIHRKHCLCPPRLMRDKTARPFQFALCVTC